MYSTDRANQLEQTISCLKDMQLYPQAQKTLVVDGKMTGPRYDDWAVLEVPRFKGEFCWGHMWDAGVASAQNEIVLYLDSDRLWPRTLLEEIVRKINHNTFLFTSQHFVLLKDIPLESCKRFLRNAENTGIMMDDEFFGKLKYEPRWGQPLRTHGKNVMSGGTAFTRTTYFRVGPVDPWYRGHGAFADTDFHQQAAKAGCKFVDLKMPELHLQHERVENGKSLDRKEYMKLALDNFIYYVNKWKLPRALAEEMAYNVGIFQARAYVTERFQQLEAVQLPPDSSILETPASEGSELVAAETFPSVSCS